MSQREQARASVERHRATNQTAPAKRPRFVVTNPRGVQPVTLPGYSGDTRIQVPESHRGEFSALGPGRYLD